jgi:hypothetical protein
MADSGVNVPSGFGGIVKFKEEYASKFNLKPANVFILIILIILFRVALQLFVK